MKKLLTAILALAVLIAPAALAEYAVLTTGNVNIRTGPGLEYEIVDAVPVDTLLSKYEGTSTDDRGVDWYEVEYYADDQPYDTQYWISSKYAELVEFPELGYLELETDINYDPDNAANYIEIMDWYGKPLAEAARALGLENRAFVSSEAWNRYYNDSLQIGGANLLDFYELTGQGFTMYGVCPGMDADTARQILDKTRLEYGADQNDELTYHHHVDETSIIDFDSEWDYVVYFMYNEDRVITCINLSTYTG